MSIVTSLGNGIALIESGGKYELRVGDGFRPGPSLILDDRQSIIDLAQSLLRAVDYPRGLPQKERGR